MRDVAGGLRAARRLLLFSPRAPTAAASFPGASGSGGRGAASERAADRGGRRRGGGRRERPLTVSNSPQREPGQRGRRSAAPECAWGLEGGVGSTHGADPILMQFRASFAFLFSFLHQINARLLPLPSRELLTLRSQHLCTCQPLRSRRRCRLLSFPWARVALRAAERRNVSPRQREGSAGKAGR